MEEVHHGRRANRRGIQDPGHVEAQDPGLEVQQVLFVVEQPGMLTAIAPGSEAEGQVAGGRPASTPEEFAQEPQLPVRHGLGVVRIDGVDDDRPVIGAEGTAVRGQQLGKPFRQEGAVPGFVGQHQGIETAGLPGTQNVVAPTNCPDEGLGATVLIEIGHPRL